MKGRLLCVICSVLFVLVGCGKSDEEQYLEKYTDALAGYMRSANTKVYQDGDSVYLCQSETMCFRYELELLPEPVEEEHYAIKKMSFTFDEIKPGVSYTVTYPEKTSAIDDGADPEIQNQLEKKFHEKLDTLGFTWEEFDDFMKWFAYVESINF